MSSSRRTQLAKRWKTSQVNAVESLLRQTPIDHEALGDLVGYVPSNECDRVDLRAFPLTGTLARPSLQSFDLTYSRWKPTAGMVRVNAFDCDMRSMRFDATPFGGRFSRCDLSSSTFATCQGMPDAVFEDCAFDDARFIGGNFLSCVFQRCRFDRVQFSRVEFIRCRFDECRLDGSTFDDASFGQSRFSGLLTNVAYLPTPTNLSEQRYIHDAAASILSLGDTNMIGVTFEKEALNAPSTSTASDS
jgi:uncharacterized protein YjbI with pentapeptide repeats